jgi:2-isopropylmalate synthase
VAEAVKVAVPFNYPAVGKDAFETSTGVHAAAVIKAFKKGNHWLANRVYSGVPADEIGLEQVITIGPMSGKSNVVFWLEKHGYTPSTELVDKIFAHAKASNRVLETSEILNLVKS